MGMLERRQQLDTIKYVARFEFGSIRLLSTDWCSSHMEEGCSNLGLVKVEHRRRYKLGDHALKFRLIQPKLRSAHLTTFECETTHIIRGEDFAEKMLLNSDVKRAREKAI